MHTSTPVQSPLGAAYAPAVGGGLLLGFSFPFTLDSAPIQGCLAFVAYVPLLLRYVSTASVPSLNRAFEARTNAQPASRTVAGRWFAEGLVMHLIAYAIAFHWVVFHPMLETVLASIGGIMGLALLASVPWALAARVGRWRWHAGMSAWALSAWTIEHALSYGSWALPWPVLSMTQGSLPHAELAAVIGAPGLTALVLVGNAGVALGLWRLRLSPETVGSSRDFSNTSYRTLLAVMLAVGTLTVAYSILADNSRNLAPEAFAPDVTSDSRTSGATIRLLLVQPSIPATDWARQGSRDNMDALVRLTASYFETSGDSIPSDAVDLVVWPESALPLSYFAITDHNQAPPGAPVPLLTGGIMRAASEPGDAPSTTTPLFNRALLYADTTSRPKTYAKHHLVPFAERVPGVGHLPILDALAVPSGGVTAYQPGPGPAVFSTPIQPPKRPKGRSPAVSFAPLICFETVVGPYVRQAARRGAGLFLGLSQVGWWGDSAVLPQYQILTALRAIETGRPIAVTTVSGPSFTASPRGNIHLHTRWMESTARRVSASSGESTWYLAHARVMHVALAGFLLVGVWLLSARSGRPQADR